MTVQVEHIIRSYLGNNMTDSSQLLELKIEKGKTLLHLSKLKQHKEDQLEILSWQVKQDEILDQQKILRYLDDEINKASLALELIEMQINDCKNLQD